MFDLEFIKPCTSMKGQLILFKLHKPEKIYCGQRWDFYTDIYSEGKSTLKSDFDQE